MMMKIITDLEFIKKIKKDNRIKIIKNKKNGSWKFKKYWYI